jgi:hypothetical protein
MKDDMLGLLIGVVGASLVDEMRKGRERPGRNSGDSPEEHARSHAEDLEEFRGRRETIARRLGPEVADQLLAVRETVGKICLGGHPPIAMLLAGVTDLAASGDKGAIMAALISLMKINVVEQVEVAPSDMVTFLDALIRRVVGQPDDKPQPKPTDPPTDPPTDQSTDGMAEPVKSAESGTTNNC